MEYPCTLSADSLPPQLGNFWDDKDSHRPIKTTRLLFINPYKFSKGIAGNLDQDSKKTSKKFDVRI